MARVIFETRSGGVCNMDILESISRSAIMPIAKFDLTHLRRGISFEGFFDLHPHWHDGRQTFTSPRATGSLPPGNTTVSFLQKYRERGYVVKTEGVVQGMKKHECEASVQCPLTVRNTGDGGVRFVPFTEEGAIRAASSTTDILREPVVYWRHGGRCEHHAGEAVNASVFDADGMNADEDREW
ncbi:hypothetical protein SCHPADRAFT_909073 [Schizopora paradoxa]|uniref:Uncharacterized protein n=1 Tax=Schizopora paradoxa TaxID=27342 RepID=A0A0H2REA5_9AGAM|nr:hypothetical protein SCHPADRAFT_909073 [Schizopora paradoxa]